MERLLEKINKKDHFEVLGLLSESLENTAHDIETIHTEFEHIAEARRTLAKNTARASILLDIVKMKLSIMQGEWEKSTEEQMNILVDEFKLPEDNNFSGMEF